MKLNFADKFDNMCSRMFHENMFFQKKISSTHNPSAWGLV